MAQRLWGGQVRFLPDDVPGQTLQVRARLDPQVVSEQASGVLVLLECLRLASGTVERDHEPRDQLLAIGILIDEPPELAHESPVIPNGQARVDVCIDRPDPYLVECVGSCPVQMQGHSRQH
jgi:hypothetical protein